jgi:hypothetical protein
MGKWLDLAARLAADSGDNRDIRDISTSLGAIVPIVPNVPPSLPPSIVDGLAHLANAPAPRLIVPDAWPIAVADALRLASDGWAQKALALGWSDLDLFGAVPDRDGDPYADGLAVKLGGRSILALCASFATVTSGGASRTYLHRGNNDGAVLMWALGRGQ